LDALQSIAFGRCVSSYQNLRHSVSFLDTIYSARNAVNSHPAIALAVCWTLVRRFHQRLAPSRLQAASVVGSGALAVYVLVAGYYLTQPHFADHVEASVAAIGSAASQGQPLYPGPLTQFQHGLPYGPLLFQLNGAALRIIGQSTAAAKAVGICAALVSLALLWYALPRTGRTATTGMAATALLAFGPMSFWTRAEPLLLLFVAAGCLGLRASPRAAALVLSVCLAAAVNLKVSGFAYFVPLLAVVAAVSGWSRALAVSGIAVLLALGPFALPSVSLPNYLEVLRTTATHPLRLAGLIQHLEWVLVLLLPSATSMWLRLEPRSSQQLAGRVGLLAGLLLITPVALKAGAGPYHYLPFIPTIAWLEGPALLAASTRPQVQRLTWSLAMAASVLALLQQASWLQAMHGLPGREMQQELIEILAAQPGSVSVGYTENYRAAWVRALPVLAGQPYILDAPTLMDRQIAGLEFPRSATESMDRCDIATWVLPKGSVPFGLVNLYDPSRTVFSAEFRRVFERRYRKAREGKFFDTWECLR
jgi:hypothetical protein